MEGQEEALGPGTSVEPLSAAAQCFLGLSTQNPPPPPWAEKLWKGSFSPREKTGSREALGAQGTSDSGALEVGLLPSSLARPGLDTNPHPPHLPGSSPEVQCQLDKSLLMTDLQAHRSDLGSGHCLQRVPGPTQGQRSGPVGFAMWVCTLNSRAPRFSQGPGPEG